MKQALITLSGGALTAVSIATIGTIISILAGGLTSVYMMCQLSDWYRKHKAEKGKE